MASSPPSPTSSVSPDPVRNHRFRFWQGSASLDELEEHLQPKARDDTRIADFLHDYLLFKHETFEYSDSMVWLSVVEPTERASTIRSLLYRPETLTFTDFLSFLREELRATGKAGVSFW
jgi:hypothetical protein